MSIKDFLEEDQENITNNTSINVEKHNKHDKTYK